MTSPTDVCIVYSQDAQSWPDYIIQCCRSDIRFRSVDESEFLRQNQTADGTRQSPTSIIVIASPAHLEFLYDRAPKSASGKVYGDFGPDNGLVLVCHEGDLDLSTVYSDDNGRARRGGRRPAEHFPDAERWPLIRHDVGATKISEVVEELLRTAKRKLGRKASLPPRLPTVVIHPTTARSEPRLPTVVIHPTTARSEEPTWIVLSFSAEVQRDAEVDVMLTDESETLGETIVSRRLNPYTFTFEAPEHQAGKVNVTVRINGNPVDSSEQGDENLTLTYRAELSTIFNGVSQIYMHLLTTTCSQLVGGSRSAAPLPPGKGGQATMSVEALDAKLSSLFDLENPPRDIPTVGFEQLFAIYRYIDSEDWKQSGELPTLIHFAAKFGLTELCNKLTDLPSAECAIVIPNSEQKRPHEIARDNRYGDLEMFLEDFVETQSLYFNQHRARYVNTNLVPPTEESHYMSMSKSGPNGGPSKDPVIYTRCDGDTEGDEVYEEFTDPREFASVVRRGPAALPIKKEDFNMPEHHKKLVEIIEKAKNKEISLAQAEKAYQLWKSENQMGSFKQKKEMLSIAKRELQNISTISAAAACPVRTAATPGSIPAVGRAQPAMSTAFNSPGHRGSNSSISSRDSLSSNRTSRSSAMSQGYTSGFDADVPEAEKPPAPGARPALPPRQVPIASRGAPPVPKRN